MKKSSFSTSKDTTSAPSWTQVAVTFTFFSLPDVTCTPQKFLLLLTAEIDFKTFAWKHITLPQRVHNTTVT
ncbi:hypothetical protein CesoFtcFv8_012417 [Champsocephalus esox]|uniref:Uncharacterized protein n=1 Tax=Champsocephalus esox TaxID=159716 RepID=A0AAN8BV75_9TELE|nr:hypothetical protein CesoFtcFv8_012417 [Champsocephalus esox]